MQQLVYTLIGEFMCDDFVAKRVLFAAQVWQEGQSRTKTDGN
jgi:hypothetical protein